MVENNDTVVVNGTSSIPDVVGTLLRYAGSALGGFVVAKGWITADNVPMVIGAVVSVGTAAWGIILAHLNKQKLVTIASNPKVADSVAVIK